MQSRDIAKRFRIDDGKKFRLGDFDPADKLGLDKEQGNVLLAAEVERLRGLQERLYADGRWALLAVLQGIDASGKDSIIEHVMSGIDPQGCEITSFKVPSATELHHDFLWRTVGALPERGRIGVFNRSHYEEVLVVRVHPELLAKQNLPAKLAGDDLWQKRFESIRDFERHLSVNGTAVLKFFMNVSKEEQAKRFIDRIDEPDKHWKFALGDLAERQRWDDYMTAYEDAIRNTATEHAPWYAVPADNKWCARLVVAAAVAERLEQIGPEFPVLDKETLAAMQQARAQLAGELGKASGGKAKGSGKKG
jgi:PPK2 family polyphosphate:nucleotide phosphotransferase